MHSSVFYSNYIELYFSPILVLKCEQGFVGLRQGSTKLECNKATYETIVVERAEKGIVYFKGKSLNILFGFR